MATLPDLSTTAIATIAYFDTTKTILKSDILPIFESFTEYDNGVDGVISINPFTGARVTTGDRISVNVRIRTDGMIYAWGLRANEDGTGAQKTTKGAGAVQFQRALLPNPGFSSLTAQSTVLFSILTFVSNAQTTAGKVAPQVSTLNYYDFQFTSTANIYVFGTTASGNATVSYNFTQPSGTSIFVLGAVAFDGRTSINNNVTSSVVVNGNTLSSGNYGSAQQATATAFATRTGTAITSVLLAVGNSNSCSTVSIVAGAASNSCFGALVIYASS